MPIPADNAEILGKEFGNGPLSHLAARLDDCAETLRGLGDQWPEDKDFALEPDPDDYRKLSLALPEETWKELTQALACLHSVSMRRRSGSAVNDSVSRDLRDIAIRYLDAASTSLGGFTERGPR